jgi:hypothetical protein
VPEIKRPTDPFGLFTEGNEGNGEPFPALEEGQVKRLSRKNLKYYQSMSLILGLTNFG